MRRIREIPSASDGIPSTELGRVNFPRLQPRPHRPLGKLPATIGVADKFPVVTRHSCGCACRRGQFTPLLRLRPFSERYCAFSAAAAAATPNLLLTSRSPTGCLPPAQSEKSVVNPDWELRRGHAPRSGRPGRPTLPGGYRWRRVTHPWQQPLTHRLRRRSSY